jgi:small GTP-binding protein
MGIVKSLRDSISDFSDVLFASGDEEPKQIGIYGPANAGKTTLANRIADDWKGETVGSSSAVPHETRRVRGKEGVKIERNGKSVTLDIFDTPGIESTVDKNEFKEHGMEEEDSVRRAREATEGISEAMKWLREDFDGVLYVLDATKDPVKQVNTMIVGIIESQELPAVILANKMDLEGADIDRIRQTFPQHDIIPLSALEGDNMDEVYDEIAKKLG